MDAVPALTVRELSERLAAPERDAWLLDVRTPDEWARARIEGFRLLDAALAAELDGLDRGMELVFLCHHGMRSESAARYFRGRGFRRVWNVAGGIDAWSREVDSRVPRY
jgi:monothiol glutaredoxin